jgi:hypothetical protein
MSDEWQSSVLQFAQPQSFADFRERVKASCRNSELTEETIFDPGGGEHAICRAGWYGFELTEDGCLLWFPGPVR